MIVEFSVSVHYRIQLRSHGIQQHLPIMENSIWNIYSTWVSSLSTSSICDILLHAAIDHKHHITQLCILVIAQYLFFHVKVIRFRFWRSKSIIRAWLKWFEKSHFCKVSEPIALSSLYRSSLKSVKIVQDSLPVTNLVTNIKPDCYLKPKIHFHLTDYAKMHQSEYNHTPNAKEAISLTKPRALEVWFT